MTYNPFSYNFMYIVYGKGNCPQCEAAKRFLGARGLEYNYKMFGVDYTMDDLMALPNVTREMPQIFELHDGVMSHIGGTSALMQHVDKQ